MKTWESTRWPRRERTPPPILPPALDRVLLVTPALIAFTVYVSTLAPGLQGWRSAELALQAADLRMAPLPEHPVHAWLGHLMTSFVAEPVAATNALSAVASACAIGLAACIVYRLTRNAPASALAALALAFTPLVWSNAIVTEVHGLNLALQAGAVLGLVSWYRSRSRVGLVVGAALLAVAMGESFSWAAPSAAPGFGGLRDELERIAARGPAFLPAFLWIGLIPACLGAARAWARHRPLVVGLTLIWFIQLGALAFHRHADPSTLAVPAILLASVSIGIGLTALWERSAQWSAFVLSAGVVLTLGVGPASRVGEIRLVRGSSERAESFIAHAFATFPDDAFVVARRTRYVLLVYAQRVRDLRGDVTIVERSDRPREPFAPIATWRALAAREVGLRPVIIDTDAPGLGLHRAEPMDSTWHELVRSEKGPFQLPGTAGTAPTGGRDPGPRGPSPNEDGRFSAVVDRTRPLG